MLQNKNNEDQLHMKRSLCDERRTMCNIVNMYNYIENAEVTVHAISINLVKVYALM